MSYDFPNSGLTYWRLQSDFNSGTMYGPWSFALWANIDATGGGHGLCWLWGDSELKMLVSGGSSFPRMQYTRAGAGGGTEEAANGTGLTAATWHHIVGTYDGTTLRCILDDNTPGTFTTTFTDDDTTLTDLGVGAWDVNSDPAGTPWDGFIAEFALYDYVLSGADTTALAGGDNPLSLSTQPLVYTSMLSADGGNNDGTLTPDFTIDAGLSGAFSANHPTVDDPPAASTSVHLLEPQEGHILSSDKRRGQLRELRQHVSRRVWR